jgi:hypothetical protein
LTEQHELRTNPTRTIERHYPALTGELANRSDDGRIDFGP